MPATPNFLSAVVAALALWALSGCASYSGSSLKAGTATRADVRALMGEPVAVHPAPAGAAYAESWEYPRGPLGRHTFMARIDGAGRLVAIDQVMTLATVAQIRIGQDNREAVRRLLGRPAMIFPARGGGEAWDYAAYADGGRPRKVRISVTFDAAGVAQAAGESYDPDDWQPRH